MAESHTIVINALQYKQDSSGIGILLRELFGRLIQQTDYKCQFVLPGKSPIFPHRDNVEIIEAPVTYEEGVKRTFYQSFRLGPEYCRDAILLTVDSKIPLLLPKSCRVVPLITDLALFRMPEVYQKSREVLWRLQYRFLCQHAEKFLAISEFTKKEMVEILAVPPEKIEVVPCAAPSCMHPVTENAQFSALRSRYRLPEHYILFVGNFNPRKNIERLLHAFDRMKKETGLPQELVIAGGQGWKFDKAIALQGIETQASVHFIGYVPDEDMPALYSAADVFAFPTLYEGFGIPVIEAQSCGTPVLTSNITALPEISGEAAFYVDPYDEADIACGLATLLADETLCRNLVQKGFENASRFSWEASVRKLEEIIEEILSCQKE